MEKNEWIRERETIKMSAVSWAASGSIGRRAGVAPVTGASSTAPAETGKNLRMKAARVAADLSQADLAAAVGATRQTIGLIEAGGYNPTLKLCIAMGGVPRPDGRARRGRDESHLQGRVHHAFDRACTVYVLR